MSFLQTLCDATRRTHTGSRFTGTCVIRTNGRKLLMSHFPHLIWSILALRSCRAYVWRRLWRGHKFKLLKAAGCPRALSILMCAFVWVVPLTKISLNTRPLITTADVICGLHCDQKGQSTLAGYRRVPQDRYPRSVFVKKALKGLRILIVLVLLAVAILFPAFDSVCTFLAATLCSLIAVVLLFSFHLQLYGKQMSTSERLTSWTLMLLYSLLGLIGTSWAIIRIL